MDILLPNQLPVVKSDGFLANVSGLKKLVGPRIPAITGTAGTNEVEPFYDEDGNEYQVPVGKVFKYKYVLVKCSTPANMRDVKISYKSNAGAMYQNNAAMTNLNNVTAALVNGDYHLLDITGLGEVPAEEYCAIHGLSSTGTISGNFIIYGSEEDA